MWRTSALLMNTEEALLCTAGKALLTRVLGVFLCGSWLMMAHSASTMQSCLLWVVPLCGVIHNPAVSLTTVRWKMFLLSIVHQQSAFQQNPGTLWCMDYKDTGVFTRWLLFQAWFCQLRNVSRAVLSVSPCQSPWCSVQGIFLTRLGVLLTGGKALTFVRKLSLFPFLAIDGYSFLSLSKLPLCNIIKMVHWTWDDFAICVNRWDCGTWGNLNNELISCMPGEISGYLD